MGGDLSLSVYCEGVIRFGLLQNAAARAFSQLCLEIFTVFLLRILYFPTIAKNVL